MGDVVNNMQRGKQPDVLIMDLSKAFDKVGHVPLLLKLEHYGIQGWTLNWIKSFLSNRKQRMVLEGGVSDEVGILSGVLQGSVLGPCLIHYYINDMPDKITSKVGLFADDTIMYLAIMNDFRKT